MEDGGFGIRDIEGTFRAVKDVLVHVRPSRYNPEGAVPTKNLKLTGG